MAISVPPEAAGEVPPQNHEAEASVLGSILLTEQALDGVLLEIGLKADHFYRPRHQSIFRSMIRLKEKADPEAIDAVTVCAELRRMGELEQAGSEAYVHSLPTVVIAAGNVLHYARIVKDHALLRRLLDATRDIQTQALSARGDPRELMERAEATLYRIGHEDGTSEVRSIEDVLHDELDKLEELSRKSVKLTGTPSGFKDLDEMTGGFQQGNLIVLAARPSMGKSALATNLAENAAVDHGLAVALFSLEMSEAELAQRFLASRARVSNDELRKGRVKADRWPKVLRAAERLAQAPIFIDDSSDLGVLELRAKARRLHSRHGLGLLIVDYLQLMRAEDTTNSRVEQIGKMSRGLKILARELEIPVVAVSQLSRAVEARPDKRPLLSDLRESGCLTGDTRVFLPETGGYAPISELVHRASFEVLALNRETWRFERRPVERAFSTGRKPIFRLRTRLGRTIRTTANHKFLTFAGWRRLDELEQDLHIALPRCLPSGSVQTLSHDELALLGHLLGDGCTLPRHAIQYTTNEPDLAQLVSELAVAVFGARVRPRIKRERDWIQVYLASARRLTHGKRNPIAAWLDELGVFGFRSYEKRVPDAVFEQADGPVATFLRHLWAADGCVHLANVAKRAPSVYYATSSVALARDVQSLLLRLGINATVHVQSQGRKGRAQHHVTVSGTEDIVRFLERVGNVSSDDRNTGDRILRALRARPSNTNRDVIPRAAWVLLVHPARTQIGMTARELHAAIGISYCGSTLYKANLSRDRALRVATAVGSEALDLLAHSDVYWDRVVSVEPDGEEEVYDLTVEGLHNFVADDIVVHNSIEQDADLVLFLYRDEYYNRESERSGEADVILAKHRNGPIGEVAMTFLSKYPKFADMARESTVPLDAAPSGNG